MSYCWNPVCQQPQNPETNNFCYSCGLPLLIGTRFRARGRLENSHQTLLCVDLQLPSQAFCLCERFPITSTSPSRWTKGALLQLEALAQGPKLPSVVAYLERDQNLEYQAPACQYLFSEYIPGQNLLQHTQNGQVWSESDVQALLLGVLPVLGHLHQHQAIHRAVRPENILYHPQQQSFVLVSYRDLRFLDELSNLTPSLMATHLLNYLAPEQLVGRDSYASDLYNLGSVCLYLLTGKSPTELFDVEDDAWKWSQYLSQPLSDRVHHVLETLVQRAVRQRYSSVEAVLADLNVETAIAVSNQPAAALSPLAESPGKASSPTLATTDQAASSSASAAQPPAPPNLDRLLQDHADLYADFDLDIASFLADSDTLALHQAVLYHAAKVANKVSAEVEPSLHLFMQTPSADLTVEAYKTLGQFYLDRIKAGLHQRLDLVLAIAVHEQVDQRLQPDTPNHHALQTRLGQLYWQLAKAETPHAQICLERAINYFHKALQHSSSPPSGTAYAELHNHLGEALGALAQYQKPTANLEAAITAYQTGLKTLTAAETPNQYAAMQNNLGTAYWTLALHQQPLENLTAAIAAYNEALKHYKPDTDPLRYGMIQNNLGTAYLNLAQQRQDPNILELAIAAYRIALLYRSF
ncbi:MAG: 4-Cys prefix domain-containing protein, partial [Cyanobacteria bacterium P01_H01_bin.121]